MSKAEKKNTRKRAQKEDVEGAAGEEQKVEAAPKKRESKGTRKSERSGAQAEKDYNIDKILKQADEEEGMGSASGSMSLMLAHNYDPEKHKIMGWLMSEKMDGVRCYWNGSNMYSRNGNLFYPPEWFKEILPKFPLDGELWTKRDDFQNVVRTVKKHTPGEGWLDISFQIFDAPKMKAAFKDRLKKCRQVVEKTNSKHLVMLEQTPMNKQEDLDALLAQVLTFKGEGVMLKDPESLYEQKRSHSLLKVKQFDQSEATVQGWEHGTGRCSNMMGKIFVKEERTGHEFKIGSGFDDAQRRNPPKKGLRITFKH